MLQYEKTGLRPRKKDLWIITNTKKDGTPTYAALGELIICSNHYKSLQIV